MRGIKKSQKGFTLTEALVVGIIGAIIAIIFLTFMRVHNTALNEGVAKGSLVMQSDVVSSQIARKVRAASSIALSSDKKLVVLLDQNNDTIGAYFITGSLLLQERLNSTSLLKNMTVGGRTVLVGKNSTFRSLNPKEVTLELIDSMYYRNKGYFISAKGATYRCRN